MPRKFYLQTGWYVFYKNLILLLQEYLKLFLNVLRWYKKVVFYENLKKFVTKYGLLFEIYQ